MGKSLVEGIKITKHICWQYGFINGSVDIDKEDNIYYFNTFVCKRFTPHYKTKLRNYHIPDDIMKEIARG